jgi:hypothetical protein
MAPSEAKKKANQKWDKDNMKRVTLDFKIAEYGILESYCKAKRIGKATLIRQAIAEKMEREPIDQT